MATLSRRERRDLERAQARGPKPKVFGPVDCGTITIRVVSPVFTTEAERDRWYGRMRWRMWLVRVLTGWIRRLAGGGG